MRDGVTVAGAIDAAAPVSRRIGPVVARRAALAAGLACLGAVALLAARPLDGLDFTSHMLRHMLLVAVAAPLLVLGAPGLARAAAISPLVATVLEFALVWAWHVPALHDAARAAPAPLVVEQASFLAAGLLVWASVLKPGAELAGAGGLLLTSMHMTLLGALICLAPAPLYLCTVAPEAALDDQRIGALVMLGIGTGVYLAGGLALVRRALEPAR